MKVDNWDLIKEKLDFSDPDKFYFIELMQRKKDNNAFPANNRMVKCYFVYSLECYDHIKEEVKKLSRCTCSRVYILLNRRSYRKCALNLLAEAAKMCIDNNFQHFPSLISSVVGKHCDEPFKNWVVDIDVFDKNKIEETINFINGLEPYTVESKIKFVVPTLHGMHLITSPFNCQAFSQRYPDIDIHKDNPTLLYFNYDN